MTRKDAEASALPPQLALAALIFQNGKWGAFDSKGPKATEKEVVKFFDTVIAICAGESSFNANATNGKHIGLFQIDKELHKAYIKGRDLTDPMVNIDVAAQVSRASFDAGHSMWRPWQAYNLKTPGYLAGKGWGQDAYDFVKSKENPFSGVKTSGTAEASDPQGYLSGILKATGILANAAAGSPFGINSGAKSEILDKLDPTGRVLSFITGGATVVGVSILALVFIILGAWLLFGRKVADKVTEVVPAGKALKAVKAVAA